MASAAAAVRKTVTILFCDLVESTALGERLDPERLRELLARWYDAMRAPVERHGGTVEKFVGDAVMAVFGVPQVHEDDALRAVRAAVEMRAGLAALNEELADPHRPPLQIRIGVNTGEVVGGGEAATLVSGDAVNTAKRLEQAAPPGEILVGGATRLLVESAVELEPRAPVRAKGKHEPVEAWRVLGTIPDATAVARRLDAPLVGRRRELDFLRNELAAAASERTCRLVTVLGPAGIGKSRLAVELTGGGVATLGARCLPYGDGISLLPLEDLVRSAGGEAAVLRAVASEPDRDLIASRVCGDAASPEELQWGVRRLLEALARSAPLVVCVEDVHWAQPAFLDLLEYVSGWSRDAPILLLCLARPELLDLRPRWPGATLTLAPLSDAESGQLLDELGQEWPLTEEARGQIAAAAEGNPLFLEQMVAMLAEGARAALPPTIQALLAARLDALEPRERAVLERAAVVGRDFARGAVAALCDGDETSTLLALVRKELLRPAPSAFAGDDGFRFRHALIRDAAYAAIPKRRRAELHQRVADWLAERATDGELVGYHLEQAHVCLAELGRRDDELGRRAGELLAAAGVRAGARGDAPAAANLLRRSLGLLPPPDERRAGLLHELSLALWASGELDAAGVALSESIDLAGRAGDLRVEWYGRLERAAKSVATQGETEELLPVARRAVEVFEQLGDDLGLARAWRRIALVSFSRRRFGDAAAAAERALAHATASRDGHEAAMAADALCSALVYGPAPVDAAVERVEAILAGAGGNLLLRSNVSAALAALLAMRSEFGRARELVAAAAATDAELGLRLAGVGCGEVAAGVERLAGNTKDAVDALRSGYRVLDEGGYEGWRASYAAQLAFILAADGAAADARVFLRVCETTPASLTPDSAARMRAAQALVAAEPAEAQRLVDEAIAQAETTDDLNLQGEMRLVSARVRGDEAEAAAARRLFAAKGNVAAADAVGLWSLQT